MGQTYSQDVEALVFGDADPISDALDHIEISTNDISPAEETAWLKGANIRVLAEVHDVSNFGSHRITHKRQ